MEFRILGPLEVRGDQGPVAVGGIKPRSVLAVLLLHRNEAVHADRLAVALWGEDAPATASKTVQIYISRLRKALADTEIVETTSAGYRLRVRADELDAERFARLVDDGRRALSTGQAEHAANVLREALALWRGHALADLAFEPFARADIQRLEEQRLTALEARVEADLALGRHTSLVSELRQLVAANPTRERLAGHLMLALYRCGQQVAALESFHATRRVLLDELGVEPGPALRKLQQAIFAHDSCLAAPLTTVTPALETAARLPVPPTLLFGRGADLDDVARVIRQAHTRVVTLVGPGGVGKTRLAIEAATRLARDFSDGVRFVSLASVLDPRHVASAIGRAVAAPTREGEPAVFSLSRFLDGKEVLLVLDNFEHLVAGAGVIAELVAACSDVTILITSREPTRLSAEQLFPVRPLDVPTRFGRESRDELERFGGVAMFVDRARARDPAFAVDTVNATHIREICHRLDGLPLALELAAARIGVLSAAELAARLDQALTLLAGGASDAPERQRTLRATIDWSFGLLTEPEREAFTHFAVFASGTTVATAETVADVTLDTLDSLVAKQLLVRRDDRLVMLETVREYALERFASDSHADAVEERLAAWSLSLLREATPHLVTADRVPWLARLDLELPNLLAALSWALEGQRCELAMQLAGELGAFWWRTSHWEPGLPWIGAALEGAHGASTQAQAQALLYRARLTGIRQEQRYRADLEASLQLFRTCDDASGIAECLGDLTDIEAWHGRFDNTAALDEAMRFAERAHDDRAIARVLFQRAIASTGYDDTSRRTRTALEHLRRLGNLYDIADLCTWSGYLAIVGERYPDALEWTQEGLDAAHALGHPKFVFLLRGNEGLVSLFLGDLDGAVRAFREALAVCRAGGCERIAHETLLGLAVVDARRGEFALAARLAGAAERHQAASQADGENAIASRLNDELLSAIPETYKLEEWQCERAEGGSLTVHEAIELAQAGCRLTP